MYVILIVCAVHALSMCVMNSVTQLVSTLAGEGGREDRDLGAYGVLGRRDRGEGGTKKKHELVLIVQI